MTLNSTPTPYVIPIASAPQKVTRSAPTHAFAPPAREAIAPRLPRQIERDGDHQPGEHRAWRDEHHDERQRGTDGERRRGGERRLHGARAMDLGNAELVARVRAECVMRHELLCDLFRE